MGSAYVSGMQHPGDFTVSLNYFGSVDLFDGLLPAMEGRANPCAVGLVSNSSQFDIDYDDPMVLARTLDRVLERHGPGNLEIRWLERGGHVGFRTEAVDGRNNRNSSWSVGGGWRMGTQT